ncbi:hypothetical protein BDZ89DRAFT_1128398 [Hymenopellis radicata]|nr:hypothetical protein BDZ89DRAFT_1128398 [Hymenopellis radicata]
MPASASSTPPEKELLSEGISTDVPAPAPIQPPVSPSGPTAETHFFGLRQDAAMRGFHTQAFSDDYDKRLPEDPYCKESAPNARVWRMYVEEAAAYDANMVGQSRDGLDVMLVFAGLFSAVVTSFLVQVSQSLQADYAQMSAVLLHDLIFIQLSLADGVSAANITRPSVNPAQAYVADGITVWVNGLWVVSLTASLVVALIAVLAKQWLHHYVAPPSGTPRLRSHIRHFRFMGLERWHVRIIIGVLPIIMHISLTLFLSGLVLYFVPLRQALAWTVGVITIIVFLLYFVANAMPFFSPQCPYKTLLTEAIYGLHKYCMLLYSSLSCLNREDVRALWEKPAPRPLHSLMEAETHAVSSDRDTLSIDAFDWMFNMSSNPSVRSIVLQALGGLPSRVLAYTKVKWDKERVAEMAMARYQLIRGCLRGVGDSQDCLECLPGYEATFERLTRSLVFLPDETYKNLLDTHFRSPPNAEVPFQATRALLVTGHRKDSVERIDQETSLFNFFLSNHEVRLHSLVWEELMKTTSSIHIFSRCQSNPALGPSYAQLMMLLASSSYEGIDKTLMRRRRLNGSEQPVTLSVAMSISPALELVIWKDILASPMLRPFDNRGSSSSFRMRFLIAAGKFALYGMQDMPTACYLRLLGHVLRLFLEHFEQDIDRIGPGMDPVQDFLIAAMKETVRL